MCAILDSSVINDVFSPSGNEAARGFYEWLHRGGSLVYSREFLQKEVLSPGISIEAKQAIREFQSVGRVVTAQPEALTKERDYLKSEVTPVSNDHELLAIARACRVSLLYTNDRKLQIDFRNPSIGNATGRRIYTTNDNRTTFSRAHRNMLQRTDICNRDMPS